MPARKDRRLFGHLPVPMKRVHIELTNKCNFDCAFCPKPEMVRKPVRMKKELAERLLGELKDGGVCDKVTFHVMGEPTLHPDFFEILGAANRIGMPVGLTTNGSTLAKVSDRLLDYDLQQLDVSLQTPDEKSFALRKAGKLSFDRYVSGITDFLDAYHEAGREFTVKLRFLNTWDFLARLHVTGHKKDGDRIDILSTGDALRRALAAWANRVYDAFGETGEKRKNAIRNLDKIRPYKWNVITIHEHVIFETYLLNSWNDHQLHPPAYEADHGFCFGMRDHFAILAGGEVVLCCVDFNGRTAIGNVNDATLLEILSSDRAGRIIDGLWKGRLVHPYCKKCLGAGSRTGLVLRRLESGLLMQALKPFFYPQINVW